MFEAWIPKWAIIRELCQVNIIKRPLTRKSADEQQGERKNVCNE